MQTFRQTAVRHLAIWSLCAGWLLVWACAPYTPPLPPPETYPSRVVTTAGVAFQVTKLKLPGTRQELHVKLGNASQWIPLAQMANLRFTGPALPDGFRPVIITMAEGGSIRGEVYADVLLEGQTDIGYWNTSLLKVDRVDFGKD